MQVPPPGGGARRSYNGCKVATALQPQPNRWKEGRAAAATAPSWTTSPRRCSHKRKGGKGDHNGDHAPQGGTCMFFGQVYRAPILPRMRPPACALELQLRRELRPGSRGDPRVRTSMPESWPLRSATTR